MPAIIALMIMVTSLLIPATSQAQFSQAAIKISANSAERNEKQGTTRYIGAVVISQGPLKIQADEVVIHDRNNHVDRITATGKPARMSQAGSQQQEEINAEAETISYLMNSRHVLLEGKAVVYQKGTSVSSNRIDYFIDQQRVKATSDSDDPAAAKQRVEVIIPAELTQPEQKPSDAPIVSPE